MAIAAKPEILPPRTSRGDTLFSNERLDLLSHLLDDFLRIPGTPIRFGLDGIVGFIPGVGDLVGGLASCLLIVAAWVRGVSRITLMRMVLNVAIETAVGSLPFVGNLFDIGWRANRRNYALLRDSLETPGTRDKGSWLFLAGLCVALAALLLVPLLLLGWILAHVTAALGHRLK